MLRDVTTTRRRLIYAACIIGQVEPEAGMKRIWLYLAVLLAGLVAIAFIPWISIGFLK